MKVEVDVDELCELRNRKPEVIFGTTNDLAVEFKRLEEERDWWRSEAFDSAGSHDESDEIVSDIVSQVGATDFSYYTNRLEERAAHRDYSVE